ISTLALPNPEARLQSLPPILRRISRKSLPSCSKGSWGLSVLARVEGVFTSDTSARSPWSRQRVCCYAIRAGRNLPDKEFRYLRTVIVTADIHGDLGSQLRACALTAYRNLSALVTCHTLYVVLTTWQSAVFLLNSRLTHFTATTLRWHPFFRSYGARLPSSLTRFHSRAWVYSTHPPVSVYGTGNRGNI